MRLEVPGAKRLTLEMTIPIRWGDMDPMGHVNNTVYFRYFESVRLEWFYRIGCRPNPGGEGLVIINAFCNFHQQLEYPGEVLARHYVASPGRSSFETYFTLERTDRPGSVCTSGGATAVWVDFPQQRSTPMPAWLRAAVDGDASARAP
jgi:acyl-CoA thioester hydrolase